MSGAGKLALHFLGTSAGRPSLTRNVSSLALAFDAGADMCALICVSYSRIKVAD